MSSQPTTIYDFTAHTIDSVDFSLNEYRNKVLLIVNLASKCGYTSQYAELQMLHERFGPDRFSVLGFPCNQFGGQEPGSNEEVKNFACSVFNVTFPLFRKVEVNGSGTHPLFVFLKEKCPGILGTEAIKWNFTKFLIDTKGLPVTRYGPPERPESISKDIEKLLKT